MNGDDYYGKSGGGYGAYIPGLLPILFGLLIFIEPKLLAITVAAFFVSLGIILLGIGHRVRQSRKTNREIFIQWFGDGR